MLYDPLFTKAVKVASSCVSPEQQAVSGRFEELCKQELAKRSGKTNLGAGFVLASWPRMFPLAVELFKEGKYKAVWDT
jgi:hypothetical protein